MLSIFSQDLATKNGLSSLFSFEKLLAIRVMVCPYAKTNNY
jgi:hypothetical protein